MSESKLWDCVAVGAGAAGMMAAIQLARERRNVLLLDSQKKIGAKILMSGGTRCNVTNRVVTEKDYCSESVKVVRNILTFYPPEKSIAFFKSIGVHLTEEKNGQCYPTTQSAQTVLDALISMLKRTGVTLQANTKVTNVIKNSAEYNVETNQGVYNSKTVILATGGLSYPNTGSDGTGYKIAQAYKHTLIPTTPALTPLRMKKNLWTTLMGISVDAVLTLWVDQKKYMEKETSLLFTHFGISGLGVLDLSRYWHRIQSSHEVKLVASFMTNAKESLDGFVKNHPKKTLKSFLNEHFPQRFCEAVLEFLQIALDVTVGQLTKLQRKELIDFLQGYELPVIGVMGYGKAEVTAGGIPFKEVNTKTLESKLSPGLFFCGEILDVDGRIGGFNFQWAWSSGVKVADGVEKYLNVRGVA